MTRRPAITRAVVVALALGLAAASAGAAAPEKRRKKPAPRAAAKTRDYARTLALVHTSLGDFTIRFFFDRAPNHVKNFVDLAASGFYNGTLFHRVIRDFVVQGGDPLTKDPKNSYVWGNGGKTDPKGNPVTLKPEFNDTSHKRGIVSMARSSAPDSASSQFFIVLKDYPSLDRQYTAFGEVVKGMDVVDRIAASSDPDPANPTLGKPRNPQRLVSIDLLDEPPAPPPASPAPAPRS
ncbi:MAG: peptidylprolyl isomerase [Thermoanaerobaculia bacterium]